MVMQARFSEADPRFYDVNRDFAHCFDQVALEVAARLEDGWWPPIDEYLKQHNITGDDLGEACRAYCDFVVHATDDRRESLEDLLHRVGWFEVPEPAQVAYQAYMGMVLTGMFFKGRRDATMLDEPRITSAEHLRWSGRRSAKILSMSRWKRMFYYLIRSPLRWWRRRNRSRRGR